MSGAFSPLDRRLELTGHAWAPDLLLTALQLDVEIASRRRAAQAFERAVKIPLSKSSLQRLTVEYGNQLADDEEEEAERLSAPGSVDDGVATWQDQPEPDAETMAVSMDGVMVNIREEGWKEVKVVAISAVECEPGQDEEAPKVRLTKHSYRAGLLEAKEFAKHQWAEACRRGLERAKRIVSVNDAAMWIWSLVLTCYAPCVEVIDWWHAVQRLWAIGHTVLGEESPYVKVWVSRLKTLLWQGQMAKLFREVRRKWPREKDIPQELRLAIGYLFHNRRRMRYAEFRAQGCPTGSGTVESACKTVVQGRCCQSGMRWSRRGLRATLSLRCALLSGRWQDVKPLLSPVP